MDYRIAFSVEPINVLAKACSQLFNDITVGDLYLLYNFTQEGCVGNGGGLCLVGVRDE